MIKVENLSYTYKPGLKPSLNNIYLDIRKGEYIAVIGPNGCGKTTLIRHLNALLLPSKGEVVIDGLKSQEVKNHLEIRRRVGMIFQNPDNQIVGMSVEEDVAFGPGNLKLPSREVKQRVAAALDVVGLKGLEHRMPYTLSGGEKQLLAIAGLLAMEPNYIVLDEATSSLDPGGKDRVQFILHKLKEQGIGIIHVTHNMEEALRADRVLLMDDGQLIADGKPYEILTRVDLLKSLGLAPPVIVELMMRIKPIDKFYPESILSLDEAAKQINLWLHESRVDNKVYDA